MNENQVVVYFTENVTFCLFKMEGWIDDKLKVAYEDDFQNVTDLNEKMKKLQKHQAFEAEIIANTEGIDKLKQVCTNTYHFLCNVC